jgi:hypothetical protein
MWMDSAIHEDLYHPVVRRKKAEPWPPVPADLDATPPPSDNDEPPAL